MSSPIAAVASGSYERGRRSVPIAEIFYSFQGEGANLGRRALFIRLMGCNLTCGYVRRPLSPSARAAGAMVCDTEYTWNAAKHDPSRVSRRMTLEQVWDEVCALDPATSDPLIPRVDLLVVSGGEPLLHQDAVVQLAERAAAAGMRMEIETNATIRPNHELVTAASCVWFNAGLKLASCAIPRSRRVKPAAIRTIQNSGRARWKFVVCGADDLEEIAELQAEFGLTEIWLSPEGTTPAAVMEQMRSIAEPALQRGWHLTTRQHVLIWGDERGR